MESNSSEQELKKFLGCALSISPSDTIVAKFFGELKDLGVKEIDDLSLVTEDDLLSLKEYGFSMIQIRKVRRAYEELSNKENAAPTSSTLHSAGERSSSSGRPSTSHSAQSSSGAGTSGSAQLSSNMQGSTSQAGGTSSEPSYTQREDWADNFRISKNSLSANLRVPLSGSQRLSPSLRRQFVREVGELIRVENPNPGRSKLRTITKNLVKSFPCLALVLYNGRKIAGGNSGLLGCLEANFENQRKKKSRVSDSNGDEDDPQPIRRKVPKKKDTYGCLDGMFYPDSLPDGETKESQENSREILKEFASAEEGYDISDAHQLVRETFVSQRWLITGSDFPEHVGPEAKLVDVLLETWPILLEPTCANEHVQILTGENLIRNIRLFLAEDAQDFIQYISTTGKGDKPWMYVRLQRQLQEWKECGFKDIEIIAVIKALTIYFDEDLSSLIRLEEPTKLPGEINVAALPISPVLISMGQSEFCAHKYMLFVDRTVMNPDIKEPVHAASLWFSMFFMANYVYPVEAPFTCEFIQRQIARIDPQTGTKRSKKAGRGGQGVSSKVLTLMTKFDDFKNHLHQELNVN